MDAVGGYMMRLSRPLGWLCKTGSDSGTSPKGGLRAWALVMGMVVVVVLDWLGSSLSEGRYCCLSALGVVPLHWGICLPSVLPWLFEW